VLNLELSARKHLIRSTVVKIFSYLLLLLFPQMVWNSALTSVTIITFLLGCVIIIHLENSVHWRLWILLLVTH